MKENACLIELAKRLDVEVPAAVQEQTEAKLLQDFFSQLQNQGASFDMYPNFEVRGNHFKDLVQALPAV